MMTDKNKYEKPEQLTTKEVTAVKTSYEKPEIAKVKLAAEEAVLTNCKVTVDPATRICKETGQGLSPGS